MRIKTFLSTFFLLCSTTFFLFVINFVIDDSSVNRPTMDRKVIPLREEIDRAISVRVKSECLKRME